MSGIGLLNEKPLHASLKQWYAEPGDEFEVRVDGFVVDIVRGPQLLEIQTANFGAMKRKLATLLETHSLRLIYPIPFEKWIVKSGRKQGESSSRRKSPRAREIGLQHR